MVSSDLVRNVIGILGNVFAVILLLSPMPTVIEIWKAKSVKQYSAAPYLTMFVSNLVWILYGLPMVHPRSLLVVTINAIGATSQIVYITIYIAFTNKKSRLKMMLIIVVELMFVGVLSALVLTLAHTTRKRSLVVGCFTTFLSTAVYAAPLSVMKVVITTKSVESMPFLVSFAAFVNASTWCAYACLHFDAFILISNVLGVMLAMSQLILYAMFYKSTRRQIEARVAVEEVVLPNVVLNKDCNNKPPTVAVDINDPKLCT